MFGFWNSIWRLVGKVAVEPPPAAEPAKTQPMPVPRPAIKEIPLNKGQYRTDKTKKTHIFLHHSAGGSVAGAIAGWNATPERVATSYLIERTGDIYEVYSPDLWANHLGGNCPISLEKASIGIELIAYGPLTMKDGNLITYTKRVIPPESAQKLTFRGYDYYEKYTPAQIEALKALLPYLMGRFGIAAQSDRKNFWEFKDPKTLPPGIYSHTTVRKDKVDIFPQKELVELVQGL